MTTRSPLGHNVALPPPGGDGSAGSMAPGAAVAGGFTDFLAVVDLADQSVRRVAVKGHTIVYPYGPDRLLVIENVLGRKSQLRVTMRSRDASLAVHHEIPVAAEVASDELGDDERWRVGLLPPYALALDADTAVTLVEEIRADSRQGRFLPGVFVGEPPWLDAAGALHAGDGPLPDCRGALGWGHRVWALQSDGALVNCLGRGPWQGQPLPETSGEYQSLFHQPVEGVLLAVSWTRFPSRGGPKSEVVVVDIPTGGMRRTAVAGLLIRAAFVGEWIVGIDVTDQVHIVELADTEVRTESPPSP